MLAIGESTEILVHAELAWNNSRLVLVAGATYDLTVPGEQTWKDSSVVSTADGYPSKPMQIFWERFRRVPAANWFTLIGTIGRTMRNPFVIGTKLLNFSPSTSGRFYCFANDVRFMYWNNCGSIRMTVMRKT
jgi:hypothetical protein